MIPGKLMGTGLVIKIMTVGAYSFTDSAREKIKAAGGKCLTYSKMIKSVPKGTDVVVIG